MNPLPQPGEVINNKQLMEIFSVGMMGGMRRSRTNNLLVLVSDYTKGLYEDHWEGDVLHYTGMGKVGPQTLSSQNKTLAQSPKTGIEVHLFEVFTPTAYTYVGPVKLAGEIYQENQLDDNGDMRLAYIFPLKPLGEHTAPEPDPKSLYQLESEREKTFIKKSLEELKALANSSSGKTKKRKAQGEQIVRNSAVTAYAKKAAEGVCDLCRQPAPFKKNGIPYLECHHVQPLAQGGPDKIENAVALCPNCHRKMHALNRKNDITQLQQRILLRDT